jgi:hypothetical protein
MKIGIIAPINFLEDYCITDIQYVLPRLLVEESAYRGFYMDRKSQGDTIILDCKVPHWKRTPEEFSIVEKALGLLPPDIIIAPSHMFNTKLSGEVLKKFLKDIPRNKNKIIKCIEGTSEKDLKFSKGSFNAIPSHMFRFLGSLPLNALYVENHTDPKELHDREGILVTSLPVRLGLQGRLLSDFKPIPDSLTFYEEEDLYPKITLKNVKDMIEMYKEERQ